MIEPTESKPETKTRSTLRWLAGALLIVGAGVAVVVSTRSTGNSAGNNVAINPSEGLTINRSGGKAYGTYDCDGEIYSWSVSSSAVQFSSALGEEVSLEKLQANMIDLSVVPSGVGAARMRAVVGEAGELSEARTSLMKSVWASKTGHCIVEAAFKMGLTGITAKADTEFGPFFGLAKLVYNYGLEEEPTEWNLRSLARHLQASNAKIMALRNSEDRNLLSCQTSEWYRLGDGRCDAEFNNAECNYDNGDCCPQTCKDYDSAWGGESPDDGNGNSHPVYDCSTATAATCVATCTASNQDRLGDGNCDADLNTEACGYDLGDCCETTCESKDYECGNSGYSCVSGSEGMCYRAGYCNNEYFGMCGSGASCILSICEDCRCHYECQDHDRYCSCSGTFNFGCLNVFRDWCD